MFSNARRETFSLSSLKIEALAPEDSADSICSKLQLSLSPVHYFEIYCAEEKSLTSAIHCGGDWRWRFCASNGAIMAKASGYRSEAECRAAIDALRMGAASARVRDALQYA